MTVKQFCVDFPEDPICVRQQQYIAQTQPQQSVYAEANPYGAVIALGCSGAILMGLIGSALVISYRVKPDPALRLLPKPKPLALPPAPPSTPIEDDYPDYEELETELEPLETAHDDIPGDYQLIFKRALTYPVVSIVGIQGTGKTTLVEWLASQSQSTVVVLDPHAALNDWQGYKVVGKGLKYGEISSELLEATELSRQRYQLRATKGVTDFPRVTYVAEEMTNWSDRVDGVPEFIKASLSDFRKANQQLIKVAHGSTNAAQGGAKGTAKMREEGEVSIKLLAKGKAVVSFPNEVPVNVSFPLLKAPRRKPQLAPLSDVEKLSRLFSLPSANEESNVNQPNPASVFLDWLINRKQSGKFKLTYEQVKGSKIGKTYGRDRETLMPFINAAIESGLLLEISPDRWQIG